MGKSTPMCRLVLARCAALIARRATQWNHEILSETSTLQNDVRPEAAARFCDEIEDVLDQIKGRRSDG